MLFKNVYLSSTVTDRRTVTIIECFNDADNVSHSVGGVPEAQIPNTLGCMMQNNNFNIIFLILHSTVSFHLAGNRFYLS